MRQQVVGPKFLTQRRLGLLLRAFLPALICGLVWLFHTESPGDAWQPGSFLHPLGTDEFGRDVLSTLFAAAGFSLFKGILVTLVSITLALILAELATQHISSRVGAIIRLTLNIVESVPTVLWVMIALIAVREPRFLIVMLAFTVVTLPSALNVAAGELARLRSQPYVEAAYILGAGEIRVLFKYMLPNAAAVLGPFALQVLGAAIAVDGAIGVIGLGNRTDLDLGVFLLRGKENFVLHPQLLTAALVVYALVYGYLLQLVGSIRHVNDDA